MDTYEKNARAVALFNGWNYEVLSDPSAREPLSSKAISSLALLGYMATKGSEV